MDIDANTIFLATRSRRSLQEARETGISEELFVGAAREAWKFVIAYERQHEDVPGIGVIVENSGYPVKPPEEGEEVTLSYLAERLFQRAEFRALKYGGGKIAELLEEDKQKEAVEEVHKLSEHLKKQRYQKLSIKTLADVVPLVLQQYENTKKGVIGIPLPWPSMTRMTMGLWPGTLTFFVARPGVGKTWTAIMIALHAWLSGKKVLIVSPELAGPELGERIVSKYGSFAYGDMVGATLGHFAEAKLYEVAKELVAKGVEGFYILDDEDHLNAEAIEQAIATVEPDLVLIDSVYMLKVEDGKIKKGPGSKGGRYDRILDTIDWMRKTARKRKLPIVGVSQLSRDGKASKGQTEAIKKGNSTGGLEDALAMTDTMLWDAQNIFAIFQDADMKVDGQVMYVPLKVRRQVSKVSVFARFDMKTMDFSEIGTHAAPTASKYDDKDLDADIPY